MKENKEGKKNANKEKKKTELEKEKERIKMVKRRQDKEWGRQNGKIKRQKEN